jgi:hypothetical protein
VELAGRQTCGRRRRKRVRKRTRKRSMVIDSVYIVHLKRSSSAQHEPGSGSQGEFIPSGTNVVSLLKQIFRKRGVLLTVHS